MFVGTSPSFDFALFSVCFLEYGEEECLCNIGKSSITVRTRGVPGQQLVDNAYPLKVNIKGKYAIRIIPRSKHRIIFSNIASATNKCGIIIFQAGALFLSSLA